MKKLNLILILVLIAIGGIWGYSNLRKEKTGYILINDLYSKFEMKKQMEIKYKEVINARQHILDSLSIQLRILANELEASKAKDKKSVAIYNYKREEYYQKQKQVQEDNQKLTEEYDAQI